MSPANSCNVCFTCRSNVGDSRVSSQKKKALRARRTPLEANLARCLVSDDDDDDCDVETLVAEWDRESSFGIEIGDSGGGVGESVNSVWCAGVFFDCCGGRNNLGRSLFLLRNCFCWHVLIFELLFPPLLL